VIVADTRRFRSFDALAPPRRVALTGLLLLAVVLLAMAFLDRPLAWLCHGLNPELRAAFKSVTPLGLGGPYLIISGAVFIACRAAAALARTTERAARLIHHAYRALYIFLVVAGSGIIADIAKVIFGRARPKLLFADGIYGFSWGATRADYWSFPSGHATTVAAVAVGLYLLWPRGLPLYLLAALLVAASRIIITEHYASDVLMGLVLGGSFAWALWQGFARAGLALGAPAPQPAGEG
jgi:membrane-associated phospholipid phosphatase